MSKLLNKSEENEYAKNFVENFIQKNNIPKYLFGRNKYANKILKQIDIDGFIDDFYEGEWLGKKVVKLQDVPKNSLILVLSSGSVKTALNRVKKFGLNCLTYFEFYKYANSILDLDDIYMNEGFRDKYEKSSDKFENIYSILADDISKKIFLQIINFRYHYDLKYLEGFKYLPEKQYFEDFINLKDEEIFIDVGSFDGYNTMQFIKFVPNYKKIHIFEAVPFFFENIKENLKNYPNIYYHNIALSNRKGIVRFNLDDTASKISKDGEIEVFTDTLDNIINEPFTYLKMDVEGHEKAAIEGGVNSILKYHPKLAISVYHEPDDLWRIPEMILEIRKEYKIYVRHYTESIYETVMYFIPND